MTKHNKTICRQLKQIAETTREGRIAKTASASHYEEG